MYRFELVYQSTIYNIDEPVGWDSLELILRKDTAYEGVFFERSGGLKFYGSARELILQALQDKHFEAEIIFKAYLQCNAETLFYEGRLNLSNYSDQDGLFECNIDQKDLLIEFAANLDRVENLTTCPSVSTNLHGVVFQINFPLSWDPNSPVAIFNSPGTRNVLFTTENNEEDFNEYFVWETNGTDTWLRCLKPVTLNFTIPVIRMGCGFDNCIRGSEDNFSPSHTSSFTVFGQTVTLRPYDFDPSAQEVYLPIGGYDYEAIFEGGTYSRACNVNDILNMRAFLTRNPLPTGCDTLIQYNGGAQLVWGAAFFNNPPANPPTDNRVRIWFNSDPFATSPTKSYLVHELLDFLIKKASNNKLQLYSRYYGRNGLRDYGANGCGAWRTLCSGFQVRNIDQASISFKQLYDSLQAMDNLALAYEVRGGVDYIRIEPKDSFFENTPVFEANEIDDIKTSLAVSKIFKLIDIGYNKWETEYTGGLLEFNSTRQYESTNITQFKAKKTALSNLIAASYVIEKVRRTRFKPTTDTKHDNDFFVFCVQVGSSPFTCEQTATLKHYNVRIHPIRNLLNFRKELSAGTVQGVGGNLRQTARAGGSITSEQNTFPIASPCTNGFGSLSDGTLIPLDTPLHKCIFVEFEYPLTMSEFETLKANTNKPVAFSGCDGAEQEGYIEEIRYKINEEMASFKLLLK